MYWRNRWFKKIGNFLPEIDIPIIPEKSLIKMKFNYLLLFSWHISKDLKKNLRKRGFKGKFIIPLPTPRIEKLVKMNKSIKLAEPFIKKNDSLSILKKVLKSNYINEGRLTRDFEKKISKLLKIKYVITCTSGTTAIFLALKSIGIKNNDEVLVPNLTFPGTVNAVNLVGKTSFS